MEVPGIALDILLCGDVVPDAKVGPR
jgi:hypothetical protein